MLSHKLLHASDTIERAVEARREKHAAEQFDLQLQRVQQAVSSLEKGLTLLDCLRDYQMEPAEAVPQDVQAALKAVIVQCGRQIKDLSLDSEATMNLKAAVKEFNQWLEGAWQRSAPQWIGELPASLRTLQNLLSDPKEAAALSQLLDDSTVKIPKSGREVKHLADAIVSAQAMIDNLHVDEEIEQFLRLVRAQKATYLDVSEHVQSWLSDNQLAHKLKVIF